MLQMRDKESGGKYKDVFNYETLETVKNITEDLLDFHAVDRNKIFSLYSRRAREMKSNIVRDGISLHNVP